MTSRKQPSVAFWATVVVVAVLLYVASFGPACWVFWRPWCPTELKDSIRFAYRPVQRLIENGPEPIRSALIWYTDLFHP